MFGSSDSERSHICLVFVIFSLLLMFLLGILKFWLFFIIQVFLFGQVYMEKTLHQVQLMERKIRWIVVSNDYHIMRRLGFFSNFLLSLTTVYPFLFCFSFCNKATTSSILLFVVYNFVFYFFLCFREFGTNSFNDLLVYCV